MGTKIQCKTVLPAFYSVKDINGSLSNGMCLLNNDEQTMPIGQHFDSFSLRFPMDGYFEFEKEKVRQTILKHESTFRHQLQELHRLYNKQRDLMNDLRMRELHKNPLEVEGCLSHTPPDEAKRMWHANHFPLANRQVSSSGTHYPRALFGCRESANRAALFSMQGNEAKRGVNPVRYDTYLRRNGCLADLNEPIVIKDDYTPISASNDIQNVKKSNVSPFMERNGGTCLNNVQSVHEGYRKERFSLDINADAPSSDDLPSNTNAEMEKKKTIFGVVLSEGKGEQIFSASGGNTNISSQNQRIELNVVETGKNGDIMGEKSYHMNLDLLQNCSHQFFKKSKAAAAPDDAANVVNKKIFGVPIFNFSADSGKANADEAATANHIGDLDSGLRNEIDLNVSLHEEEDEEEAPTVLESEDNIEEVTRLAAEAIVSISSCPSSSGDCLKWFADFICSQVGESSTLKGGEADDDDDDDDDDEEGDSIPEGMDYFEFTTLKLRDEKCYEPSILDVRYDDGGGGCGGEGETQEEISKRRPKRRGPAARRDFQRDVLPGLVSLSRHEVSEDILTFQELLKETGGAVWRSRMSRGRKNGGGGGRRGRRGGPPTNHHHHPMCSDSETTPERLITSLTGGWGRRTRRRPRQRFPKGRTHIRHV